MRISYTFTTERAKLMDDVTVLLSMSYIFAVFLGCVSELRIRVLTIVIKRTCLEDSLRSVCKSSQTWRNALSLRPCYRPSRIVTSLRGKERHLIKGK
jgi:hypothetical protein